MIRRLLIANRGEIAVRIARTARAMGIETVAIYSDADARAMHVQVADLAVRLGGSVPAESYLDVDKVIEAARSSGADAIHPGYGFLSEVPEFAEAVGAAGLVFVGPPAAAIRAMGLKDAAKQAMAGAGVPVVPGYGGEVQDDAELASEAARIGYPVLIKAVAGGGGKGMRRVEAAAGFADALASCRAEARAAFGNDRVLVEKWIEHPRHIEVQVFADAHGNAVHLYERDCSLQRRHQKVIEEAPAPGMTEALRTRMGEAAVRAAQAIGYVGAGTVEFIADGTGGLRPDGFWFMEMNTRLQVEHPVTEAITGVDLVEWQLRVASGERLPLSQKDIPLIGHAMEARLYAEDPQAGFLPATGTVTHLEFASEMRVDSGVRAGDAVSPHYDPMIAKLIAHGADREAARRKLVSGVATSEIAGLRTNQSFLRRVLEVPEFVSGTMDTGLIERGGEQLAADPLPDPDVIVRAALALIGPSGPGASFAGFTLWAPQWQRVVLRHGATECELLYRFDGPDRAMFRVGDRDISAARATDGVWWVAGAAPRGSTVHSFGHGDATVTVFDGEAFDFHPVDPLHRGIGADASTQNVIEAPMPGLVRAVDVAIGDGVEEGARLTVLEAMKMEHALRAPRAAVVAEVFVRVGDQVAAGAPLVRLDPLGGDVEAAGAAQNG